MSTPDRLEKLGQQTKVTGINYVNVYEDQKTLDVHFFNPQPIDLDGSGGGSPAINSDDITITSIAGNAPSLPIAQLSWLAPGNILQIKTSIPGSFVLYKLIIDTAWIDIYYNSVTVDFKVHCKKEIDCSPGEVDCPPDESIDFPVDYLARDFNSFRRALLEFAAQKYPEWSDRLIPDEGIMLLEIMSSLGDEMAYYQDRIAHEAYLESATQLRSLKHHLKLIDYTMHEGLAAHTWVTIFVDSGEASLPSGTAIHGKGDGGLTIVYEVGKALQEVFDGHNYLVKSQLNTLYPHIWDEDDNCLAIGSTHLYLQTDLTTDLILDDFTNPDVPGKWLIFKTNPSDPIQPIRIHLVRITKVEKFTDEILNKEITKITWEEEHAMPFQMDLLADFKVFGNIVPARAGRTVNEFFQTGEDALEWDELKKTGIRNLNNGNLPLKSIERQGHDRTLVYLFTLPGSDQQFLSFAGKEINTTDPELILQEFIYLNDNWVPDDRWKFTGSFLGETSSLPEDQHFTLEDGNWKRIIGFQNGPIEFVFNDYAGEQGKTIRFGDGEFGKTPSIGNVFKVTYRLSNGKYDNVAEGVLNIIDFQGLSVINMFEVTNGESPQTKDEARQLAPEEFKAITYRAVNEEDYVEVTERLSWVQNAGASFRWTGSWLSAFATPDPRNSFLLQNERKFELINYLDRFRQTGREVNVTEPEYANIDMEINVCIESFAFKDEMHDQIWKKLIFNNSGREEIPFFSPENFTFGTALDRTALEACIQSLEGVKAVEEIRFRRRGWFQWRAFSDYSYHPGERSIIRLANDSLFPEKGSLKLFLKGGA